MPNRKKKAEKEEKKRTLMLSTGNMTECSVMPAYEKKSSLEPPGPVNDDTYESACEHVDL